LLCCFVCFYFYLFILSGELGSEMLLDLRQVEISGLGLLREQLFGERLRSLVFFPKSKFPKAY